MVERGLLIDRGGLLIEDGGLIDSSGLLIEDRGLIHSGGLLFERRILLVDVIDSRIGILEWLIIQKSRIVIESSQNILLLRI